MILRIFNTYFECDYKETKTNEDGINPSEKFIKRFKRKLPLHYLYLNLNYIRKKIIIEKVFSLLLIAGAIHGFMFNVFTFFYKKKFTKVIGYLNLTVFFISLNNLQAWLRDNGYFFDSFFYQKFLVPWYVLILPMFYAFLVHYLKIERKIRSLVRLSLIIFGIELITRSIVILLDENMFSMTKDELLLRYNSIEEIFNASFGFILFLKSVILVFKQESLYKYILGYDDIKWIKLFLKLGGLVFLFWVFAIVLFNITGDMVAYNPLRLSTSILLYWIGYQGFYRYHVVEDRIFLRNQISSDETLKIERPEKIEQENGHSQKHLDDFHKIDDYIISQQRFLDASVSMEVLSEELEMSTSHFSKVINTISENNFSDYINSYRVNQAKQLLSDKEFENYTIVAIGLECGFNSKSTFYAAFKKFTSQTPTEFRSANS